jgi:dTDP-4-amino-4,6-dideoxygalactose transaminase
MRAVIVVHWAASMVDVAAVRAWADPRGVPVIEDAAQAHGATWHGRRAGSLGRLGCFSMQHSKVLTCGEGGAVVTDDDELAGRLEELRADSRRYRADRRPGELELAETGSVLGANFCLGEFAAALLCAQLPLLDEQHASRDCSYRALAAGLAGVPGVRLPHRYPAQDGLSIYELPILFDRVLGVNNTSIAAALTAELGVRVYTPRPPLHRSALLRPATKPALAPLSTAFERRHVGRAFPGAETVATEAVLLHHSALLEPANMDDVVAAVAKVATAARGRHLIRARALS